MEDLKPCPFCGAEANEFWRMTRYGFVIYAQCQFCGASTRPKTAKGSPEDERFWNQEAVEEVIKMWNRRAE